MAELIWNKKGAAVDERIQRFLAGDDVVADRALFLYDIRASVAHVRGLSRIGVVSEAESKAITEALSDLAKAFETGEFVLDDKYEDGHSAIESVLVDKLGDAGRRVHTGRSRNDQVQVAMRLYLRDALSAIEGHVLDAAEALLERAEADAMTPMPGYTHLQRAVPSSVGLWLASFAEAMLDNADLARSTFAWIDQNPLGTAAGYGVNLPLDRKGVTEELGFARMQISPMYAQNSRGKLEIAALFALHAALGDVRRLAWDLSLFTTAELAFVVLPAELSTGSSIMPNKRNPDVIELLRASPASVWGAIAEVNAVLSLPSGYQRDLQATKAPVLRAMAQGIEALSIVPHVVRSFGLDRVRMAAAVSPDMYATDRAVELAAAGVPFRTAYRTVADELDTLAGRSVEESLTARVSPGATGDLMLPELRARLVSARAAKRA